MKIIILVFLLLSLSIVLSVPVDGTNKLYITDDGWLSVYAGEPTDTHRKALIEQAKKTMESLPAEDFPEGNWGEITNGCQLSLRFTKATYTNVESVEAILLLRNVTNQNVKLGYWRQLDSLDGPARFEIVSSTGGLIPEHYYRPSANQIVSANSVAKCPIPGTQSRCVEHLDGEYHLTNGAYTVRAIINMQYYSTSIDVKSAAVPIKIEDTK